MTKRRKGRVSQETFDDFLASQGMLEACEDRAIKEIISDTLDTLRVELT
jgi:antitoxin HicB